MARILLVDENPVTRALSRKTLLLAGHRVNNATTAAEALDAISQGSVDVAIVDLSLSDLPGVEAVERIRAANDAVVIIAVTEEGIADTQTLASLAGLSVLRKPCTPHELVEAVSRAFELRRVVTLPEQESVEHQV